MLKNTFPWIRTGLVACLVLAGQAALAAETAPTASNTASGGAWARAPRHSAGIAPDPAQLVNESIVQVYAARTYVSSPACS